MTSKALDSYRCSPAYVAQRWEQWCGPSPWSRAMFAMEGDGRYVVWFGGYPRSKSAIPLCFQVFSRDDAPLTFDNGLRELQAAVSKAIGEQP